MPLRVEDALITNNYFFAFFAAGFFFAAFLGAAFFFAVAMVYPPKVLRVIGNHPLPAEMKFSLGSLFSVTHILILLYIVCQVFFYENEKKF